MAPKPEDILLSKEPPILSSSPSLKNEKGFFRFYAVFSAIAASVKGLRLKVPKNHMFGGRKYSFRARIEVR
jgi:hypothetical protein